MLLEIKRCLPLGGVGADQDFIDPFAVKIALDDPKRATAPSI
jgi:hypothetical protein